MNSDEEFDPANIEICSPQEVYYSGDEIPMINEDGDPEGFHIFQNGQEVEL